jgi:hypothetical protein
VEVEYRMLKRLYNKVKWIWSVMIKAEDVKVEAMHRLYGKKENDDKNNRT